MVNDAAEISVMRGPYEAHARCRKKKTANVTGFKEPWNAISRSSHQPPASMIRTTWRINRLFPAKVARLSKAGSTESCSPYYM